MIRFNFLLPGQLLIYAALLLVAYLTFGVGGIVGLVVICALLS